jgi:hypothetical protein
MGNTSSLHEKYDASFVWLPSMLCAERRDEDFFRKMTTASAFLFSYPHMRSSPTSTRHDVEVTTHT